MEITHALDDLARTARSYDGLQLLVLYGSRAAGDGHEGSDWDLGYLADDTIDAAQLAAHLTTVLSTDAVDLTDLARASGLLRFDAARRGRVVHEREPGAFEAFVLEATLFWCDAESIIRRAQAEVLAGLDA